MEAKRAVVNNIRVPKEKRVEFHNSVVTTVVKIIDGDRSAGIKQFQHNILINTDAEWGDVREKINKAIKEVEKQVNGSSNQ